MFQDLRYGVRMLFNNKAVTAVAVLSLSLGIGANTAIFSLIDAVLLKMLPVKRPEQLYFINNVGVRGGGGAPPYPCFERFRDQSQSFTGLAAFTKRDLRIRIDGQREEITAQFVSGNYFSLLGVNPLLGRALSPVDDAVPEKGGPDGYVAVISDHYWTRRFGRRPETIGKIVQIGNDSVTIIGVTPPEFYGLFPGSEIDISLPTMFEGAGLLALDDIGQLMLAVRGDGRPIDLTNAVRNEHRVALGARRRDVLWLALREALTLVIIGAVIGLIASLSATQMATTLLFGLKPNDPLTIASATLLLGAVAALAAYLPARRAASVCPMAALRNE